MISLNFISNLLEDNKDIENWYRPVDPRIAKEIDKALGIVPIPLRLIESDANALNELAQQNNLILVAYIRDILIQHLNQTKQNG